MKTAILSVPLGYRDDFKHACFVRDVNFLESKGWLSSTFSIRGSTEDVNVVIRWACNNIPNDGDVDL